MAKPVTPQQITKRAARRHALVAHRREDEDLVERQPFGENAIEPHIGKDAAGETEMPRLVAPQQPLDRAQHGVFKHLLDQAAASSRLTLTARLRMVSCMWRKSRKSERTRPKSSTEKW